MARRQLGEPGEFPRQTQQASLSGDPFEILSCGSWEVEQDTAGELKVVAVFSEEKSVAAAMPVGQESSEACGEKGDLLRAPQLLHFESLDIWRGLSTNDPAAFYCARSVRIRDS